MMNFEQFTEELRAAYPNAGVISATEQPLTVAVDGQLVDVKGMQITHQPCWLRVDKADIRGGWAGCSPGQRGVPRAGKPGGDTGDHPRHIDDGRIAGIGWDR
jgi:hypothetical protein